MQWLLLDTPMDFPNINKARPCKFAISNCKRHHVILARADDAKIAIARAFYGYQEDIKQILAKNWDHSNFMGWITEKPSKQT